MYEILNHTGYLINANNSNSQVQIPTPNSKTPKSQLQLPCLKFKFQNPKSQLPTPNSQLQIPKLKKLIERRKSYQMFHRFAHGPDPDIPSPCKLIQRIIPLFQNTPYYYNPKLYHKPHLLNKSQSRDGNMGPKLKSIGLPLDPNTL